MAVEKELSLGAMLAAKQKIETKDIAEMAWDVLVKYEAKKQQF